MSAAGEAQAESRTATREGRSQRPKGRSSARPEPDTPASVFARDWEEGDPKGTAGGCDEAEA